MPTDHHETRSCGCVLLHRRVYCCERHAQLPEALRDKISKMGAEVLSKEIDAARTLERERCAKIAGQYAAGTDPNHMEPRCGATARQIEKEIRQP